ncbi:hypothetical protein CARUB_v10016244mg [Capsella rubella]|uniref:Leucine-rich repeat-containing N-terminal plant-type domain-containing protein n=1 Tax=Capsella rubella TaxID=81985 RepID=R0GB35_9BRAS|nr:hypothetical protein CARUB_v10016244mg [Capsella rubella]
MQNYIISLFIPISPLKFLISKQFSLVFLKKVFIMSQSLMRLNFLLLLLLSCVSPSSFYTFKKPVVGLVACGPQQIQAFTQFKNEFDTHACNHSDSLNGVWCDNSTGAVTKIRLRGCLSGTLKSNSSLFQFHQLRALDLSDNKSSLNVLDLSSNSSCMSNFLILRLRKNNLEGSIPDKCDANAPLQSLDVGYNRLTGKLPRSLLNCSALQFLSVDHNKIEDTFPFSLKALPKLQILILRSNKFYGSISPPNNGPLGFPELRILEIADNNFTGSLSPDFFVNWKASSLTMNEDLGPYMSYATLVYMTYRFSYQQPMDLHYKGLSMEDERVFASYATIDFSGNRLEGEIPESIGLLKALIALNLSNNAFTGHIPLSLANLRKLESLDLSSNQLSGTIPNGLGNLSFLADMNVSHNQLNGEIPQGTQITGQPKSSFERNAGLCGFPLEESCFGTNAPPTQQPTEEEDDEEEQVWNWKGVAIGYGIGMLLGLAIEQIIALYKPEWLICLMKCGHR